MTVKLCASCKWSSIPNDSHYHADIFCTNPSVMATDVRTLSHPYPKGVECFAERLGSSKWYMLDGRKCGKEGKLWENKSIV